jgi:FADH2 O2-dependent halogenase
VSTEADVIILGTGIAGTLLGSILARHGVRVLFVEKGEHPRFAIGESTVPETTFLLDVLSRRYDVPEIGHLRNFQNVRRHVTSACGIKRGFSFVYHHPGEEQRGEESTQFPTWGPPFGPDLHLFRQDIDAYLLAVAIRYGALVRQRAQVTAIDFNRHCVTLELADHEHLKAAFLVDASGHRSPVAEKLGLRESPCGLSTRTRTLFTHMVNVPPYDRVGPSKDKHRLPIPFSQGTLHHLFRRGWFWVIPFDNHAGATNPLCSVGLTLDVDEHPATGLSPEVEFRQFAARFPSVEKHLAAARAVRAWVATDRLQYMSTGAAGDRYFLMPHAAGSVDALFSAGLSITASTVGSLAHRIISATRDREFSANRFRYPEEWMLRGIRNHDRLVACSYVALSDFELWNAWHRVWMLGSTYGGTGHVEIVARFESDGDPAHWAEFERPPHRGSLSSDLPEFATLFHAAAGVIDEFKNGTATSADAARRIYALLERSGLCPAHWHLTDPSHRCPSTFSLPRLAQLASWGYFHAPPSVRRNFDLRGRVGRVFASVTREVGTEVASAARTVRRILGQALR